MSNLFKTFFILFVLLKLNYSSENQKNFGKNKNYNKKWVKNNKLYKEKIENITKKFKENEEKKVKEVLKNNTNIKDPEKLKEKIEEEVIPLFEKTLKEMTLHKKHKRRMKKKHKKHYQNIIDSNQNSDYYGEGKRTKKMSYNRKKKRNNSNAFKKEKDMIEYIYKEDVKFYSKVFKYWRIIFVFIFIGGLFFLRQEIYGKNSKLKRF